MKKKAIIVSGYFNPIHKGHIEYFNNAKAMADELFVIVNNDFQRELKGSNKFQEEEERLIIVGNIKAVDTVFYRSIKTERFVKQSRKYQPILVRLMSWALQMGVIKTMKPFQSSLYVKK